MLSELQSIALMLHWIDIGVVVLEQILVANCHTSRVAHAWTVEPVVSGEMSVLAQGRAQGGLRADSRC